MSPIVLWLPYRIECILKKITIQYNPDNLKIANYLNSIVSTFNSIKFMM